MVLSGDAVRGADDINKAVIFDLDGTLWDASREILESWNDVIKSETGSPVTMERLTRELGKPMDRIFCNLFPQLGRSGALALLEKCSDAELAYLRRVGAPLYDGVRETLSELHGRYSLYIVSNCQSGYIEVFEEYHGLCGCFNGHLSFGDTGLSKAANISKIIKDEKIKGAVYVGDTQLDERSAAECRIPFIYAGYGFGNIVNAKYSIIKFSDLADIADMLLKQA